MVELKENNIYQEIDLYADGVKIGEAEVNITKKMLSRLRIESSFQNKGYGTEVVRLINEKYGTDNLWVEASNTGAIRCYEKNGYKIEKPTVFLMRRKDKDGQRGSC